MNWSVLGVRIRTLRERAGLTQVGLAERAGVAGQMVSALERAERGNCEVRTLVRLADALGVPLRVDFDAALPPEVAHLAELVPTVSAKDAEWLARAVVALRESDQTAREMALGVLGLGRRDPPQQAQRAPKPRLVKSVE